MQENGNGCFPLSRKEKHVSYGMQWRHTGLRGLVGLTEIPWSYMLTSASSVLGSQLRGWAMETPEVY